MGLITGKDKQYYEGNDFGNYQFISLDDIINQFEVVYVGENKIIPKARRVDIAFHAQRALAELSFDTLKSFKSQQINVPPSLQMILPHDYVNYTKISSVDSAGIKHPLYPTQHTSNPFQIQQDDDNEYVFNDPAFDLVKNGNFADGITNWSKGGPYKSSAWSGAEPSGGPDKIKDKIFVQTEELRFEHHWFEHAGSYGSRAYSVWQQVDVSNVDSIELEAFGTSASGSNVSNNIVDGNGLLRVGVVLVDPATGLNPDGTIGWPNVDPNLPDEPAKATSTNPIASAANNEISPNNDASYYNFNSISGNNYLEWSSGENNVFKSNSYNVQGIDTVYVYVQSYVPFLPAANPSPFVVGTTTTAATFDDPSVNIIDQININSTSMSGNLLLANANGNSSTWDNYKSHVPSERNINDYQDYENNIYWPNEGERYGLEPQHAQTNGSFYIDQRLGKIHFSSNMSGEVVILDYISDSLGTDAEMHVHKFAEEAMYRSIAYAIISTSSYAQALAPRFKKEKFAAVRQAKLRLSNIKLEEITQILRGKSKQIKH